MTIGTFDGVHLGHKTIIKNVIRHARLFKRKSIVLTFDPNPLEFFGPGGQSITTLEEKIEIMRGFNADVLILLKFTRKFALLSSEQFVKKVLLHLAPREVIVGSSHTFGREGKGNAVLLRKTGKFYNFKVTIANLRKLNGKYLNSTVIRSLIRQGKMEGVKTALGRYFSLTGKIVKGTGRGKALGFPTANLKIPSSKILPQKGVYAGYVWIAGRRYKGAINVGCRPTFAKRLNSPRVEVFIIGFKGKLYGRILKVDFVRKIRDEKKFNNVEALKLQIKRDILKLKGRFDGS